MTEPTAPAAISTRGLSKRYGKRILAVDGLDLSVRPGEVYGLIGPNGAGKTTLLRLILGLVRPTAGEVSVLGEAAGSPRALARIGSVVEMPSFYPYLSGRDNLRVVASYAGIDHGRIPAALDRVGLGDRAGDKVGGYSLGMRQRLALASAFMKEPDLYLLDEPTNGLDPHGIAAMRGLIRELASGGHTVLLASHLLTEVEQVCDRIGIINGGRLLAEESVADLRGASHLLVRVEPLPAALALLQEIAGRDAVEERDGTLLVRGEAASAAEINRRLVGAGLAVSELRSVSRTLEEAFMHLTGQAS
jgi:ABC-type multidrug transport system ATPase subunit